MASLSVEGGERTGVLEIMKHKHTEKDRPTGESIKEEVERDDLPVPL